MAFAFKKESTDRETVEELLKQIDNFGLFRGVSPFDFMMQNNLLYCFQLERNGMLVDGCTSVIRIFNYFRLAIDESYLSVTADGRVVDNKGVTHEPSDLLSLDSAPSGWEIYHFSADCREKLIEWLDTHKDD